MRVALLAGQLHEAGTQLSARLSGLTDDEYLWEPVPGCWTARPRATATTRLANGRGAWVLDYDLPDPDPPPFTTIAWRLLHVAMVTAMYADFAFAAGTLDFDDFDIPPTAAGGITWWTGSLARFRQQLDRLPEDALDRRVRPPWMEAATVERMVRIVLVETVHHGAEIGCLRDLYRHLGPT